MGLGIALGQRHTRLCTGRPHPGQIDPPGGGKGKFLDPTLSRQGIEPVQKALPMDRTLVHLRFVGPHHPFEGAGSFGHPYANETFWGGGQAKGPIFTLAQIEGVGPQGIAA
jgi:hypothetical protein